MRAAANVAVDCVYLKELSGCGVEESLLDGPQLESTSQQEAINFAEERLALIEFDERHLDFDEAHAAKKIPCPFEDRQLEALRIRLDHDRVTGQWGEDGVKSRWTEPLPHRRNSILAQPVDGVRRRKVMTN